MTSPAENPVMKEGLSVSQDLSHTGGSALDWLAPSAVLGRAAALVEPEGKWLQGDIAGDRDGRPLGSAVTGADFCAHCWCVFGAIQKAGWLAAREADKAEPGKLHSFHREAPAAGLLVCRVLGLPLVLDALAAWNDATERTQAEVVGALRQAADLARSEGHNMLVRYPLWDAARAALSSEVPPIGAAGEAEVANPARDEPSSLPAPDAQQGEGAKPCHRDEALAALDWPRWSCPFGCPALFDPSPACPFHGDSTLEQALASAPPQQGDQND